MARWIDADALEYDTEWSEYHDGFTAYSQMAIDTAPSIDIVFCKDCISADEKPIADGRYWCNNHGCYMRFCSDGEREGE